MLTQGLRDENQTFSKEIFWLDLPQNREPVLEASDRTGSRMKIIIAACAHDKQMNHSFAVRTLLRDTLDDFCIAIATYCAGFNDD